MFSQVSVCPQGDLRLCLGSLCPGGSLSGGLCPEGVSVQEVSVQKGFLSMGSLSGGLYLWGSLSGAVREAPADKDPQYSNERAVHILLECILVRVNFISGNCIF